MSTDETPQEMLALPASTPTPGGAPINVTAGGNAVALDHLGPMVVQVDGSLMRITDWATKTDHEKAMIQRVIAKRNKERLDALLLAQAAEMD
ncbi:hypothetical protein SPRG_14299 [Saprolegnia parasitica CBS 223.65]|uniref:Uncharacterized protein n=1 Tax=Saprolegnia parasitica (strain CBS 223.65) TaxID=695850 RepID=A0A067BYI7_SAPPC|nr:hypothetical protein SPRG_14299 [Saprolegnia parasitica CBS 223.65]KDO19622.1 hypothetical protein SPRG_14299 [Saprolegnia parasitica CBS 223.65]|eukprot:XP_012209671.1 hypothetical protein SPRG_14299 [Saprolegnia parasitica CBS 223.65]